MNKNKTLAAVLVAVVVVGIAVLRTGGGGYRVSVIVPEAGGTVVGGQVRIAGEPVGSIESIGVVGNAAKLTLSIDKSAYTPLHAGTTADISWNSLLGRRIVDLTPGPSSNPVLRSGTAIASKTERVELDDVAAMLDPKTRGQVQVLVKQLQTTLEPNTTSINTAVKALGPFAQNLGAVLQGVGQDGPAIKALVQQLHQMVGVLASRHDQMAATVRNLDALVAAAVTQDQQLSAALDELPGTVRTASTFFARVPAAVDETIPLLEQLQPAARRLPAVAARLNPVLTDLRPTVGALRPTLVAARSLLAQTPGLLDTGKATLPQLGTALGTLQPAVDYLRPYTPEVIGFLDNWASIFSAKNASGHFGRALIPVSATSFNSNPGLLPPGMQQFEAPLPGSLVGQSWTDAVGDEVH